MGLFSIVPVQRFLDSAGSEHVYSGTRLLVSGFLGAMQARNISCEMGKAIAVKLHEMLIWC